jgi:hypothetical protein
LSEYVITPLKAPAWRLDPTAFITSVEQQWPTARTALNAAEDPMAADALIPFDAPRRELGISLDKHGYAIILDPADPDTAAEFVTWYLRQLPAFDPEVRLITDDFEVSMPLAPQTTADEVETFLRLPR